MQEKAIRLINFKDNNTQVSNRFAQSKILKFKDFVHYQNINFVKKLTEKNGPASFRDRLQKKFGFLSRLCLLRGEGVKINRLKIVNFQTKVCCFKL